MIKDSTIFGRTYINNKKYITIYNKNISEAVYKCKKYKSEQYLVSQ